MPDEKYQVFAVIRIDRIGETIDRENASLRVTVKEVLPSQEDAAAEASRLNTLNGHHGAYYFWEATRYYPSGRG